ncbi:MAG: CDGSH iron-sulfur domain-containing protein [Myxococcales bacterium]|nr:CDGSH iron-sulfur domain-containing protein [Myxococcales bacterium]
MTSLAPETAPSREQLLYLLHEAAEIEHNLMCCYLYAAFSLKVADERWTQAQRESVADYRRTITGVALEEMTHLCLVGNLMSALGAQPFFNRPNFPIDAGPYPDGFVMRLQGFSLATLEHFEFVERPHGADVHDNAEFAPARRYQRSTAITGRLSPLSLDYETVGALYNALASGLAAFCKQHGPGALFLGDPALQVDASFAPLPGVTTVTDLASALRAIETIVAQGEGAGADTANSHFNRFVRLRKSYLAHLAEDPSFEPAWPAATNPVMNRPVASSVREHIDHPDIAPWLDIGNAIYTTSLRCLAQGFGAVEPQSKAAWLSVSAELMRALVPVGQGLAARPAHADRPTPNAGLTFTSLRTLAPLPPQTAARFVAERIGELVSRARALRVVYVPGETDGTWSRVIDALVRQQARLASMDPLASAPAPKPQAPTQSSAPAASTPQPTPTVEIARGKSLTVLFEAKRCVHSRHCVLDAPGVFKANTPGEWIFPDQASTEALVEVAHKCPSGAIRYERTDGGPAESPPAVNTLFVRENGPYAVRAALDVGGDTSRYRATLCRCGQSKNKPYCDGSHVGASFRASGEPDTTAPDPLAVRNGTLEVTPVRNGPLRVEGNLEICAGTGRTVARVTSARLCRCGQSKNKPFCDLSHVAAGFEADGE